MAYDIRKVRTMTDLIGYFSQNLRWNIDVDDFDDIEDISYDFEAEDIGLKEEAFAKISSLRQLQPLVDGQRWGIFCVEFDSDKFEVTALRKILSGLVPKRRNSADHAVWDQKDLMFICNWGKDNNRTIGIAHFEDKDSGLPQIKMISCAPAMEDFTQIKVFEDRLSQLAWPKNTNNIEAWRESWAAAFVSGYRQAIHDSVTLTVQLAAEAQNIRNRILDILEVESRNGYVHLLYEKFRNTLIHDMTEQQFADMYAQTVVYGLFSARCMDTTQDNFSAEEAIDCIPNTNPFLKSLMKECLGSENNTKLSFDELEISNVVDLLRNTRIEAIIQDFNRQTGGGREDPVIHFYEEFLTAYDKAQKVQRGVYYTPQPVVNFMVRAVDSIIKEQFGLRDGLASEETKKIKVKRKSYKKRAGQGYKEVEELVDVPAIQVLDPATGTGTFLRETILQIYENFKAKHKGLRPDQLAAEWNKYVPEQLLPRLNGFELMMAPYAVAHMKLAMVLKDTGYDFNSDSRLNVYLTNSLEAPGNSEDQMSFFDDPLASESIEANKAKKNNGINVVIGNPPYAVSSANKSAWIEDLLEQYKTEPGGLQKLKEQKHSIDSDETKFIRYGQHIIEKSESGILAYINPHGYLDKPTFRGMRWQLLKTFDTIYVINLHGNSHHHETAPDGSKDENVFDIQQGVCINIFVKRNANSKTLADVYYADLYGERNVKYTALSLKELSEVKFTKLSPIQPYFFFVPYGSDETKDYYEGFCLEKLLTTHLEGIQTGKDKLVLQPSKQELDRVIQQFISTDSETAREKFGLGSDGRDWAVAWAQEDLKNNYPHNGSYFQVGVRPFDLRWSFYTGNSSGFIKCCRDKVSREMIGNNNLAFVLTRNAMPQKPFSNFLIVNTCVVGRFIGDFSTSTQVFPVFSFSTSLGKTMRQSNFNRDVLNKINAKLGLMFTESENRDRVTHYNAYDLVGYIYAYLNSCSYRQKYKECLCRDFPYIPYPNSKELFFELAHLGSMLIELHTQCNAQSKNTTLVGKGVNKVISIKRKGEDVLISKEQFFSHVSDEVWNYWLGGHQIVQKWIKERKGSTLTNNEIDHYCNIVGTIERTISISKQIDDLL